MGDVNGRREWETCVWNGLDGAVPDEAGLGRAVLERASPDWPWLLLAIAVCSLTFS
jgi:hypothetical protein